MKTETKFLILFLLCLNGLSAQTFIQGYADVANQVTQTNITNNLTQFEALGVKYRGTAALQNTLDWIKNKYISYGYTAGQMVEDSYSYSGSTCKNLILTKIGTLHPNTYVIVCGHYDTVTGTGTNDNGSGTSILLEIARLLRNVPTDYSIKFINFSGEEDGLRGSQHYVASVVNGTTPKMDIKLVFNIDEVGGVAGMVNNTITCDVDQSSPTSNNAASAVVTNELATCVDLYSPLNTFINFADATDYIPFENNGEIITGFYETNISTRPHTANDFLINMDPVYVYNVAKAAVGATMHFAIANTTLGRDDFDADFQVSFFPNPAKDFLSINFGTLTEPSYQFSLIDINGKIVLEKTVQNPKQLENIALASIGKGMYLANLHAGDKNISRKIVIE
ncbi:M28 family peptidase [Flavobacterium humi]|uniref:M28 family peptidase n=1 Tax=Flavobacterium humi TaxID=2562683 RepID=A0A4Z0LB22_9FLAO|nr:M28 family peptidase [Flavobacterium humi]TGD58857.1 M28 family peptidase [Flavobacterium humi]